MKVITEHENTAFLFSRFIWSLLTLMFLGNSFGENFLLLQFLFFFTCMSYEGWLTGYFLGWKLVLNGFNYYITLSIAYGLCVFST